MGPTRQILPCGGRLHLQHGPIDLVIGADGDRRAAFTAAARRFETILEELVAELPLLRARLLADTPTPKSAVARRMFGAGRLFAGLDLTAMAAVAGSVADEVLGAMRDHAALDRAYVNNGGDIALFLAPGASFETALMDHGGQSLGRVRLTHRDGIGGIATSGRHGRSHSLGIADSVTVLANTAAKADVAATLIANAVDVPGHPAITRRPAIELDDQSDLGSRLVVTGCGPLSAEACEGALAAGLARAERFAAEGHIAHAALFLQGHSAVTDPARFVLPIKEHDYA